MPPSHHSSSSHSSHSSSHSSSRSSSSFSHASSHSSSSHSSHSSFNRNSSIRTTPTYRTRSNQPRGYIGTTPSPIHCVSHDYIFYATDWESEGTNYKAGYYDENGTYYSGIALQGQTTTCKCAYCDTMVKITWDGGAMPACPNCGAPMNLAVDTVDTSASQYRTVDTASAAKSVFKVFGIMMGVMVAIFFLFVAIGLFWEDSDSDSSSGSEYTVSGSQETKEAPASLYVAPIDRTCRMDSDGNYYDKETGCYFWFDDWIDPAQWQYWYEGVSSDYGDYGWMEYSDSEQQWYIEADEGNWIKLPDTYDTSKLWHFDDAYESGF